jgi:hypothetical protein
MCDESLAVRTQRFVVDCDVDVLKNTRDSSYKAHHVGGNIASI